MMQALLVTICVALNKFRNPGLTAAKLVVEYAAGYCGVVVAQLMANYK